MGGRGECSSLVRAVRGHFSQEVTFGKDLNTSRKEDFPGGPVVKTPCSQHRGPWVRSLVGEDPACHVAWPKKRKGAMQISGKNGPGRCFGTTEEQYPGPVWLELNEGRGPGGSGRG